MKIRQIAFNSILAAMCAVLGVLALDFGNLKITFESVPVLIGALMFGAPDGAAIGFAGTFIYQVICYGFTATTFLWILPYCVCGFLTGWYAKRRGFRLSRGQTIFVVVFAEIMITTLNTGVLYIDSKIYGYYSAVYIFGTLLPRYAICLGKAAAVGAGMPKLVSVCSRAVRGGETAA